MRGSLQHDHAVNLEPGHGEPHHALLISERERLMPGLQSHGPRFVRALIVRLSGPTGAMVSRIGTVACGPDVFTRFTASLPPCCMTDTSTAVEPVNSTIGSGNRIRARLLRNAAAAGFRPFR